MILHHMKFCGGFEQFWSAEWAMVIRTTALPSLKVSPFCCYTSNSPLDVPYATDRNHKVINKIEMNMPTEILVQQYIIQEYYSVLQVFTDGSKEPESGRTAATVG